MGGPLFICRARFAERRRVLRLRRIATANRRPGPALSKMGYALKALQCGLETCITSTLRRRRQGVEAADIFIRGGGLHYFWLGRHLDVDAAKRGDGSGVARAYAESGQWRDHVQYW